MGKVLVVIAAACLLGVKVVGDMGLEDDIQSEALYNQMVCEGSWPDYKEITPSCN